MGKPLTVKEALEVFRRVWSGESIKDATENNSTKRRALYEFCEINEVEPPKKDGISKKILQLQKKDVKLSKKMLSNESIADTVRKGIVLHADKDSSWARTAIQFLDSESKGKSGTVGVDEYAAVITGLFKPHLATCHKCGAEIDTRKEGKKKKA